MIYRGKAWNIFFRVLLLFATLLALAFFIVQKQWLFAAYVLPFSLLTLIYFFRYHKRISDEMDEYVQSVHYRDFTRNFAWRRAPFELRSMRRGFNEINDAFKTISREKEAQFQYLQNILELVDTGILSFETENGQVLWMNEFLKRLLDIPYLKNVAQINKWDEHLCQKLKEIRTGENKVISIKRGNRQLKVLMNATAFQTNDQVFKLIAFQNVNETLEETESLAWQKLLSVMTHEIMNSVAPIASLADTLKKRVRYAMEQSSELQQNALLDDLELGIDTIRRRSEGLTKFADTYRNLSKITRLQLTKVLIRDLFENIFQLMQPTLEQKGIEMEIVLRDTGMMMDIDRNLIEQVLINLVMNAIEAVKEQAHPNIILSAGYDNDKSFLTVADNGKGIPEPLLDKIFIPFFSTRKNGNGIGLSLCKQIMLLHQGTIQVHTKEMEGTAFRLEF